MLPPSPCPFALAVKVSLTGPEPEEEEGLTGLLEFNPPARGEDQG